MRIKAGVLGNCQANGVSECLKALVPGLETLMIEVSQIRAANECQRKQWVEELKQCDFVAMNPISGDSYGVMEKTRLPEIIPRTIVYPTLEFTGFHPDCCYVITNRHYVASPIGDYNSAIAAGAFLAGLPVERVARLFNAYTYACLGYFNEFNAAMSFLKTRLSRDYPEFDLSDHLPAGRLFMHSINHPGIEVLFELAKKILLKLGITPVDAPLPEDRFKRGAIWPVYPEIAKRLSIAPTPLVFKTDGRPLSLDEFIQGSYAAYTRTPEIRENLDAPMVRRAESFIRSNS